MTLAGRGCGVPLLQRILRSKPRGILVSMRNVYSDVAVEGRPSIRIESLIKPLFSHGPVWIHNPCQPTLNADHSKPPQSNTPWIQNPVNPNLWITTFDHQFDDEPVWSDEVAIPQCRHGLGVEGIVAARLDDQRRAGHRCGDDPRLRGGLNR